MRGHRVFGVIAALAVATSIQFTSSPMARATSYCLYNVRTIWITSDGYIHAGVGVTCPKSYQIHLAIKLERFMGGSTYNVLKSNTKDCYNTPYCPSTGSFNVMYKPYAHNAWYCTHVDAWYKATSPSSQVNSGWYRECQYVP